MMAKSHTPATKFVLLSSETASSEGETDDYIPDHWHKEPSDVSNDEVYAPPRRKRKYRHEDANVNCTNGYPETFVDVACDDGQQSEPLFTWTMPNVIQPVLPPFTATWGCRVNTDGFLPINYFQLFLDNEFFENTIKQTNLYAAQFFLEQQKKQDGFPESSQWTPTDLSEMQKFWGLMLCMGINQKLSEESYWSPKNPRTSSVFLATMSLNRFLQLQKFLHYNDNTQAFPPDHPQFDDLFKLRPTLDHLLRRFQEVYIPGQNLVLDKSLLSYKGRIVSKEYFPEKQRFCTLHRLCESSTGYTYRFRIFINKIPNLNSSGFGINENIVDDLVHPLYNQGYHLYMNQSYCNLALLRMLYTKGTLACGAIHPSKGFLRQLKIKKQRKGETTLQRCEELLAVKYKGSKDLLLVTTIHDESTLAFAMEEEQNVTKPKCLLDYNYYMAGVERSQRMIEPFIAYHRGMVGYKRLVVYLVQLAIFNAYVVYHQTSAEKRLSFQKFQESVINSLLDIEQVNIALAKPEAEERLIGRHFPEHIPSTKKTHPSRRCKVCYQNGLRKDTRYYCPDCSEKPALCLRTCFRTYHTKENY